MNNILKTLLLAIAALAIVNISAAENSNASIIYTVLKEDLVEIYYHGDGTLSVTVNNSLTQAPHEVNITITDNAGGGTKFNTTYAGGWVGTTAYSMFCSDNRVEYANVVVRVNGQVVKDTTIYKNKYCLDDMRINTVLMEGAYALNVSVTNPNEKGIEADVILRQNVSGGDNVYSIREYLRPGNNTVTLYAQNPGQYEVLVDGDGMKGMAWQYVTINPDRGFVWIIVAFIAGVAIAAIVLLVILRRSPRNN